MAHNGKTIQVGLTEPQGYNLGFPFINLMKNLDGWHWEDETSIDTMNFTLFDANGYPTVTNPSWSGSHGRVYSGNGYFPIHRSNNWICRAKNCSLTVAGNSHTFGSSLSDFSFQMDAGGINIQAFWLFINSVTGPLDIAVFHADDLADYNNGYIWARRTKDLLKEAGVVRFMDAQETNTSTVRQWSDRKPMGHYSYAATYLPLSMVRSPTALTHSGAAYSITIPGFTVTDGARFIARIPDNSNVGSACTLTVNGGTAIPMADVYGYSPAKYGGLPGQGWAPFLYSALLNKWLVSSFVSGGGTSNGGISGGYPAEACGALITEMNNDPAYGSAPHPWFNIPMYAADFSGAVPTVANLSDYTTQLATYCKNNMPAGIIPRFEPFNEQWNPSGGFWATEYTGGPVSTARGSSGDDEMGVATSLVGQAVNAVYGGAPHTQTLYHLICGMQTGNHGHAGRYDSPWGNARGISSAKNWLTHLAVAGYWEPSALGTATETGYVSTHTVGNYTDPNIATYLDSNSSTVRWDSVASLNNSATANLDGYRAWANAAAAIPAKLCQYEGGQNCIFDTFLSTPLDNFRRDVKPHARMLFWTKQNLLNFMAIPGCEFPAEYLLGDRTTWGIWDWTLGWDLYSFATIPPRWQAILDINGTTPAPLARYNLPASSGAMTLTGFLANLTKRATVHFRRKKF